MCSKQGGKILNVISVQSEIYLLYQYKSVIYTIECIYIYLSYLRMQIKSRICENYFPHNLSSNCLYQGENQNNCHVV